MIISFFKHLIILSLPFAFVGIISVSSAYYPSLTPFIALMPLIFLILLALYICYGITVFDIREKKELKEHTDFMIGRYK
jgi:hypothetical protein